MKVKANWTIAYKNKSYNGGEVFEMDKNDFLKFQADVTIVKDNNPSPKNMKTKKVEIKKTK